MKKYLLQSFGTLALIAVFTAARSAGDAPTDGGHVQTAVQNSDQKAGEQTPPADQEKKGDDQTPGDEEKAEPDPKVKLNSVTLGYTTRKHSGDERRLNQFGNVPSGFAVDELTLFSPWSPSSPYGKLVVRNLFDDDYLVMGQGIFLDGRVNFKGSYLKRGYYDVPIGPSNESDDKIANFSLQASIAPNLGAFFTYTNSERKLEFAPPKGPFQNKTKTIGTGIGGKFFGGYGEFTYSDRRFEDPLGFQPTTAQRTFNGSYNIDLGPAVNLGVTGSYSRIMQTGLADSIIKNLGLNGSVDLGEKTYLTFDMNRQDIELPNILNSYDRKRLNTSARLVHKQGGWLTQFGFRHRENERVRKDHTFVDVPSWNTYDVRISGKLSKEARLTLRGSWDDLTSSAVPQTLDTNQLIYDDQAMAQVKVDGGSDNTTAFFAYTFRFRQNKQRGMEFNWHNISVGGSQVMSPTVLGYAEFSFDRFSAKSNGDIPLTGLNDYFADSTTFTMGFDITASDKDHFAASWNTYSTNNVYGSDFSVNYRRQIASDQSMELTLAPWRQDDRLFGFNGYKATIFSAKFTVKF